MPPKPKNKLLPSVRVNEELYKTTVDLADKANEYLSDYIRKAVEQRNAHCKQDEVLKDYAEPLSKEQKQLTEAYKTKPTIPELKEKVKEMEKPDKIFHPCPKGGK